MGWGGTERSGRQGKDDKEASGRGAQGKDDKEGKRPKPPQASGRDGI